LLQTLLELPTPAYLHHELVRDATGNRLAKRDEAETIRQLRRNGLDKATLFDRLPPLPSLPPL
jgi:glutamyl-Q tRNA(Asp) synthetase